MACERFPLLLPVQLLWCLVQSWWYVASRTAKLAAVVAATLAAGGAVEVEPEDDVKCEPLNLTFVYTANAEVHNVIHQALLFMLTDSHLFGLRGVGAIDRLVAVAGSLSHLSLLTSLDPREIFYIDVNDDQLLMNRAIVSLIKLSASRLAFLSAVFARPESAFRLSELDVFPREPLPLMEEVAGVPAQVNIVRDMYMRVRAESGQRVACAYGALVEEYTSRPLDGYPDKRGRICDYLAILGVPAIRQPHEGAPSICSLQFGQGWLASEATFHAVRDRLQRSKVEFLRKDLFTELPELVNPNHRTVLYTSNVLTLGAGRLPDAFKDHVEAVHLAGAGHLHIAHFERHFSHSRHDQGLTEYAKGSDPRYKKHMAALSATALQLLTYTKLVEVTCSTPYGFKEFEDGWATGELAGEFYRVGIPKKERLNVDPAGFRALAATRGPSGDSVLADSACLLHILVGGGCKDVDFFTSLAVGMLSCARVVVLEHNRDSNDFLIDRHRQLEDLGWLRFQWLSAAKLRWLLTVLSTTMFGPDNGTLMVPVYAECVIGIYDGCRNFIMSLDRSTSLGFAREKAATSLDDFLPGFLGLVNTFVPEGISEL